jgi:outer membrane receptor protein involved in Fe transport
MKNFILIVLILMCQCTIISAHHGAITGKIISEQKKQVIENVSVQIDTLLVLYTNEQGGFMLQDLEEKKYTLRVSHFGFVSKQIEVEVKNFETSKVEISLQPKPSNLQEIKISANQRITKNIINKLNAERIPINSAQDMLRIVPGLLIAQHAGGGKAEQIFLRGFDCDHGTDIAIGVDGMPVNMVSHAHGQGYADLHFVIPEMVEQIQVNKGSYQASAGDFSTAGNIQFATKKYLPHNTILLEKGMFNNNRILGMLNILPKKWDEKQNLIVAGEYNFNKGFFESAMNLHRFNFFSKYNLQINNTNSISLQTTYFTSNWNASGQIPQRAVHDNRITRFGSIDNTEGGHTSRINMSVELKNVLKNNAIIKQQIFYNRYQFELNSNFTFFKNDSINGDMIAQKEVRDIFGYNGTYQVENKINGIPVATTIGLQARFDNVLNSELSNVKQQTIFIKPISFGDIQQANVGGYLDENIAINNKWKLNLGLRYDLFSFAYCNKLQSGIAKNTQLKGTISPKVNLYYAIHKNAQLFAMFGKSFHSNDARVLVAQRGQQILPNALGSEIGTICKPYKNTMVTASIWRLDLQQEFVYVGDESVVEVSGATKRIGLDVGIKYQVFKNLQLDFDGNYAYARSVNEPSNANRIPLAPSFTSIGGLTYTTKNGMIASLRYRHLADRSANENNTSIAKGYTLLDAVIKYKYKNVQLGLQAENVWNTNWNEAQFETETKLKNETEPVSEIHFTSGTPLNIKASIAFQF